MKKLLLINSVCGVGSTGRICADIARQYVNDGYDVKIAYGRHNNFGKETENYAVRIGTFWNVMIHAIYTLITDRHGLSSKHATKKFLKWATSYNPDVLWLHNIHGFYINYELLFDWIKSRPSMHVKWTLHDCWAFTGHCAYFTFKKCDKWKKECYNCPSKKDYPQTYIFDSSKTNYIKKKKSFSDVENMQLIAPSKWLADLTRESFLKCYPVEVVHNKINTEIFKSTPSTLRNNLGLNEKKIILGVASPWGHRKGLNDFIMLSRLLSDDFAIVLVGLSKSQIKLIKKSSKYNEDKNLICVRKEAEALMNCFYPEELNGNYLIPCGTKYIICALKYLSGFQNIFCSEKKNQSIVCIPKINDLKLLASYYTMADYFINPTYEDNFPTVNLEARACGTSVVCYDTGGCRETLCI